MKLIFQDLDLLRTCMQMLNDSIEKYGVVDVDFMNTVCVIPNHVRKYTDTKFGWTEKFSEGANVEVSRLMDGTFVFIFTIPEPKEL